MKPGTRHSGRLLWGLLPVLACGSFDATGGLGLLLQNPGVDQVLLAATVTVTESSGFTTVIEGGTGDSYGLVLAAQPADTVTIAVAFDTAQVTVGGSSTSPQSFVFSPTCPGAGCWSSVQTVTVAAVNDAIVEGNHTGHLTHTATSADAQYSGAAISTVTVNIRDRRRIFVAGTSPFSPAVGLGGLDAICAADANKPTTDTYRAMVAAATRLPCTTANCAGGSAEHASWVLAPATSYYAVDGTTLIGQTNAGAGIFTFPLTSAWTGAGASHPWTGMNADWTVSPDNCSNWTSSAANGRSGAYGFTNSGAINGGLNACTTTWPSIVCVAQ